MLAPVSEQRSVWQRLPALVRAILLGLIVAFAGVLPWQTLVGINLLSGAAVPWSTVVMAAVLFIFVGYLCGFGWPRRTQELRRRHARSMPTAQGWLWALFAGAVGLLATLVFMFGIYGRFVQLPTETLPDTSGVPWYALLSYIAMTALVAGVAEEMGFRGYMQSILEESYGPWVAIGVTALVFGLSHLSLEMMPVFVHVSLTLGIISYLTNSVAPAIVLHAGYDFLVGLLSWQFGALKPLPPASDLTNDTMLQFACGLELLLMLILIWAFARLAAAREPREHA